MWYGGIHGEHAEEECGGFYWVGFDCAAAVSLHFHLFPRVIEPFSSFQDVNIEYKVC